MEEKKTRTEKVLEVLNALSSSQNGYTRSQLMNKLHIKRSTLSDILTFLEGNKLGLVTSKKVGKKFYYSLNTRIMYTGREFKCDEVQAIQFCTDMCSELLFKGKKEKAWRGLRKYYQNMSRDHEHIIGSTMRHSFKGRIDYSDKSQILDVLFDSLSLQQLVHIDYKKINSTCVAGYKIIPVDIIVQNNALYLDAVHIDPHSAKRKRRFFSVCRIHNAELRTDTFKNESKDESKDEFEPEKTRLYGLSYGPMIDVKVRYDRSVKDYIEEREWGERMIHEKENDDFFILSFKTSSKLEFESWVLSFGEHVECLEPLECREHIQARIEDALKKYT